MPDQRPEARERAIERIKVPGNYSKPESIAKYLDEKAEEAWLRTSLDGGYGELVCVTFAVGGEEPVTLHRTLEDSEAGLLAALWEALDSATAEAHIYEPVWVGHRVGSFDLRFLYHRSVIHRVRPRFTITPDMKPWHRYVRDTSYMWTGEQNSGIALDRLAECLGIASPKELFDGGEVWGLVREGRYAELVEYNRGDTLTAREVFKRLSFFDA